MAHFIRTALGCITISIAVSQSAQGQVVCETADWQLGNIPIIVFEGAEGTYLYPISTGERSTRHLACVGTDCASQTARADLKAVSWHYSLAPVGDGSGELQWLKEVVFQPAGRYWRADTVRVNKYLVTCDQ